MYKHLARLFIYALLLFFSLSYPMTSFAAWKIQTTTGGKQVLLQWTPVKDATNYKVCYATEIIADINNCLNYAGGAWQDITESSFNIVGLTNGKAYYFRVLAENAATTLEISKTIVATPYNLSLNDTGITTCSDGVHNKRPCPLSGYPNQDAQSGRDIIRNGNSNGHAGFDFTKIGSTGVALAVDAKSWNCVKDNVTGLIWEVKTDDNGLHDKAWRYSWYEPDNAKNGGSAGLQNGGSCGNTSSCDTDGYVNAVNSVGWCGYKDWRMPSRAELYSIVDYSRYRAAIDSAFFPNARNRLLWSSSPHAYAINSARLVSFDYGNDSSYSKAGGHAVWLVRSGQ